MQTPTNREQTVQRTKRLRPANRGRRIRREQRTIEAMLLVYCRHHHDGDLCDSCSELLRYARQRLDNCVFGESKMPCSHCAVHCYSTKLRARIIEVMRWSGPRMMTRYPLLSLLHLLDKLRAGSPAAARSAGARSAGVEPNATDPAD